MDFRNSQSKFLFAALAFLVMLATRPAAYAEAPCCDITGVNSQTGVVTAKVNATGQVFQFTLNNRAQLSQLKVGQAIYANSTASAASSTPNGGATGGVAKKIQAQLVPITIPNLASVLNSENPNHLPDLVPFVPVATAECSIPAGSTCEASCPPVTVKRTLGVENLWPYPANGTVLVNLSDQSGNVLRIWTVNGAQGNATVYPGNYQVQLTFKCSGAESAGPAPAPNYTLKVSALGTNELNTNNNQMQIYIPPDAPISP